MCDVTEIEAAIKLLTPAELKRLRAWFVEQDAQQWDREFEEDANAGRLDGIAERALAEHRRGNSSSL